jgi:hypothetical protein
MGVWRAGDNMMVDMVDYLGCERAYSIYVRKGERGGKSVGSVEMDGRSDA